MALDDAWLPLFPLKTVLFPAGVLPLKVFEPRYIDMISACMKDGSPFGVILIKNGMETGVAAEPESVGCLATIANWDMPALGVMMLRVHGGERFRIVRTRVLSDQRLEAMVRAIPSDPDIPVSDTHLRCARTLKMVIEDLDTRGRTEHGTAYVSPFAQPIRLDSAAWVANRWCEILPIQMKARQKLLELDDARQRLSLVHQYLQQHGIL
jgi:uncharacterized protein